MLNEIKLTEFAEEVDRLLKEAIEIIRSITKNSKKPSTNEKLDEVFRNIHTIKGTALFFNLPQLKIIAHKIECLLDRLKKPDYKIKKEGLKKILDLLSEFYQAVQLFKSKTDQYESRLESISHKIDKVAAEMGFSEYFDSQNKKEHVTPSVTFFKYINKETLGELKEIAANIESNGEDVIRSLESYYQLVSKFEKESIGFNAKIYMLSIALKVYVDFLLKDKKITEDAIALFKNASDVLISTISLELMDINNLDMDVSDSIKRIKNKLLEKGENYDFSFTAPATNFAFRQFTNQQFSIRIQQNVLKQITSKFEDLEKLNRSLHKFEGVLKKEHNPVTDKISGYCEKLEHIQNDLQKLFSGLYRVPLIALFQRLHILIEQVSKQVHKNIRFEHIGDEIQLDKHILDQLKDCLSHMVRNSCDHGIENEDERLKKNKNPYGTIHVGAFEANGILHIQFKDDGKGIDVNKVKEKMLEMKLIPKSKINKMSKQEIISQILTPGLSTADSVTYLSGRGVGLDVLNAGIKKLNGTMQISSEKDEFTEFSIIIPIQ